MTIKSEKSQPQTKEPKANKPGTPVKMLTVRMYDVGFGDCFLLFIPLPDGRTKKVLFDCGSIKYGPSTENMEAVVDRIIEDVRDPIDHTPRIDVIVATHRHKDHIIGFDSSAWDQVVVGEVWLPWTEDPEDHKAVEIRSHQMRIAEILTDRIKKAQAKQSHNFGLHMAEELSMNAMTNDGAVNTLVNGFSGSPRRIYLSDQDTSISTDLLPEVKIHVLGPSEDEDIINKELKPKAGETYLKMSETGRDDDGEHPMPFRSEWSVSLKEYQLRYNQLSKKISTDEQKRIQSFDEEMDGAMAMVLDRAINGTSLFLVFQIGSATLLFPGDAQLGTWRLVLDKHSDLLAKVDFYKVGHHGSFNATPQKFVEYLVKHSPPVQLMLSVYPTQKWLSVPKQELITAMTENDSCKMARSDFPQNASKLGFTIERPGAIDAHIPF